MYNIPYYNKRSNGQIKPGHNYNNYPHQNKKNYFKNKNKQNNNYSNNYPEERKKNYYYENPNSHHFYSQKNNNQSNYSQEYIEEKKISESAESDNINEEENKDELLRIRINLSDSQFLELVINNNDNISEKVEEFCKTNFMNDKLFLPLYNKVKQSLEALKIVKNKLSLNENDFLILNKLRGLSDGNAKENN